MTTPYVPPTITTLALDARFIIYTPADLRPDGYPLNWPDIATAVKHLANNQCEHCHQPHNIAAGYMLTVHHLDMVKANCQYKNLVALCQRCHLRWQAQYHPNQRPLLAIPPWMVLRGLI